jgi:TolB-like protein
MRRWMILIFIFISSVTYADTVDRKIQAVFQELSEKYIKKHPAGTVKKGLAVLEFSEKSDKAKKAGIGNTIRENLSRKIISSNLFYLVDRDTFKKSISEIEISQTGFVDDKSIVQAGKMVGIQVFITGSVSDVGEDFLVSCRVIDVETGTVVAMAETKIPQDELVETREKYAYEYISQYGLGINIQMSYIPKIKSPVDGYTSYMIDTFVNYRPELWLNFKLGVSYFNLDFNEKNNISSKTVFPTITGAGNYSVPTMPGDPTLNTPVNLEKASISYISPYIGFDYNWTPSRLFTLGLGVGLNIAKDIEFIQQFDKGYYDLYPSTTHSGEVISPFIIKQNLNRDSFIYVYRIEVKPQVFLSPRLTLGLYFAYMIPSTSFKVSESQINGESSNKANLYYNINPKILADGRNVEDMSLRGFMIGGSLNFYF